MISLAFSSAEREPESVWSSFCSDWTVTASLSCPTSSVTSTRLTVLAEIGTFSLRDSLNPARTTRTV